MAFISPRYSSGANGLGSKVSWEEMPPGRKIWMTLSATRRRLELVHRGLGFSHREEIDEVQSKSSDADREEIAAAQMTHSRRHDTKPSLGVRWIGWSLDGASMAVDSRSGKSVRLSGCRVESGA